METHSTQQEPATTKSVIPIAVAYFGIHVDRKHDNNDQGFINEYEVIWVFFPCAVVNYIYNNSQSLHNCENKSIAVAATPQNKMKNRFANICACKYNDTIGKCYLKVSTVFRGYITSMWNTPPKCREV